MAITIGGTSFPRLVAQPFQYSGDNPSTGQVSRRWVVSGLLTASEWLSLLGVYDTWRASRIDDEDSLVSASIGTTISFSGTGPGGQTWSNIQCWVDEPPTAEQNGYWLLATIGLVDANEALAVLLRQQELASEQEDLPDFGTVTIGTTTLTLRRPMESYGQGPSLNLTAGGVHYIEGPKVVYYIRDIEGTTDLTGWNNIRSWYESQIVLTPSTGSWYPISVPTASATNKIANGVKVTEYIVSIQLGQVI